MMGPPSRASAASRDARELQRDARSQAGWRNIEIRPPALLATCRAVNQPGSDTERALGMLAAEQAALRRVATLVASAAAPDQVFHAVAEEAGRLLGAKTAATVRFAEQGGVVVGRWDVDEAAGFEVGTLVPYSDPHVPVYRASQYGGRIDDYTDVPGEAARITREAGYLSSVVAPIVAGGRTWGALFVFSTARWHFGDERSGVLRTSPSS